MAGIQPRVAHLGDAAAPEAAHQAAREILSAILTPSTAVGRRRGRPVHGLAGRNRGGDQLRPMLSRPTS